MRGSRKIQTFTNRYPLVGPLVWVASIQFFITQLVVAMLWGTHYSTLQNTISDLGNSACGIYSGRYICSPLYSWMNLSFIILGITMALGSVLIYHEFRKSWGSGTGFGLMALAGIGTILVGAFPENTVSQLHSIGAFLAIFIGDLALLFLGYWLDLSLPMQVYTLLSGGLSALAFLLFVTHNYLGLGIGGMERLAAHPQTLWLIVFGIYMSSNHYRIRRRKHRV